jgi:hypothetical protein
MALIVPQEIEDCKNISYCMKMPGVGTCTPEQQKTIARPVSENRKKSRKNRNQDYGILPSCAIAAQEGKRKK